MDPNRTASQKPPETSVAKPAWLFGDRQAPLWIVAAVVALVAVAVFAPGLGTRTFTSSPDSILRLPLLSHVRHVPTIFAERFLLFTDGEYRPFAYAVLACLRTFVGPGNAVFWTLWLLAFHVLNAVMVYAVARHFTGRPQVALIALGVFLLHPMASAFALQVNLFPWMLGGTFYLACFLCYLRYVRTRESLLYVLGLVLFACGLLTSHALLTLPVLLLLCELVYEKTRLLRTLGRLLPFGVLCAAAGMLFLTLHPHRVYFAYPPGPQAGMLRYWVYSFAAGGLDGLVGLARGCSVEAPVSGLFGAPESTWNITVLALALTAWLVMSVLGLRRRNWLAVGVFLLFAGVLPRFVSLWNQTADGAAWSYRYLPLVGFALLAAAAFDRWAPAARQAARYAVVGAAAAVVLVYGVLLVVANVHARTPEGYWQHVLTANPRSEIAGVKLGKVYLARGDAASLTRARGLLFTPAVKSVRESCLAMARYYSRRGEKLAAVVHLGIANREDQYGLKFHEGSLTAAEIFGNAGALDFAEQFLGTALMADPTNTAALRQLADVLALKGYLPAAVECAEDALNIDPGDPQNVRCLDRLREALYAHGEYKLSEKIKPPEPDWLRYAIDQGRSKRIRRGTIDLARTYPDDPVIQLVSAICLSEAGLQKEALERIERGCASLASVPFAQISRCWIAMNAGDTMLALKTMTRVRHLTPRSAKSWRWFGEKLLKAGQVDVAVASFVTSLKANPNQPDLHATLAGLLLRRGRFTEAADHYRQALTRAPGKLGSVHNGLGYALMHTGQLDEAIEHLRKSIEIDPRHAVVYMNLADACRRNRDYAEGIRALSEGMERVPGDVGLRMDLAWTLATAPDASLRDGERAVRLAEAVCAEVEQPGCNQLDVLAAVYAEAGRFKEAIENARKALKLAEGKQSPHVIKELRMRLDLYQRGLPVSSIYERGNKVH